MQLSFTEKKNIRKSFGKLKESLSIPNLIEVQKNSYKELTEFNFESTDLTKGFDRVFKSIFPIEDLNDISFKSSIGNILLKTLSNPLVKSVDSKLNSVNSLYEFFWTSIKFGIDKLSFSFPKLFLIFFFSVKDNCIYIY